MTTYVNPGPDIPVVLVAQLGSGGEVWKPLTARLDDVATVAYDRPGTGISGPRPAPNPPLPHSVFARELAELLDALGIAGPVVLVGHSFGGNIVKMFAADYPGRVAGIVSTDGSLTRQRLWYTEEPLIDGDLSESTEVDTIAGEVELLNATLPRVPAAVLASRALSWDEELPHPAIDELWSTHQRLLAREFGAPLVIARSAGHQLQRDVPDLVAYLIRAVRAAALDGGTVDIDSSVVSELGGDLAG